VGARYVGHLDPWWGTVLMARQLWNDPASFTFPSPPGVPFAVSQLDVLASVSAPSYVRDVFSVSVDISRVNDDGDTPGDGPVRIQYDYTAAQVPGTWTVVGSETWTGPYSDTGEFLGRQGIEFTDMSVAGTPQTVTFTPDDPRQAAEFASIYIMRCIAVFQTGYTPSLFFAENFVWDADIRLRSGGPYLGLRR
jgi:hypothetical protein